MKLSFLRSRAFCGLLFILLLIGCGYLLVRWNRSVNYPSLGPDETDWVIPWRKSQTIDWKFEIGALTVRVEQYGGINPFRVPRSNPTDMYLRNLGVSRSFHFSDFNIYVGGTTRVSLGSREFELPCPVWMHLAFLCGVVVFAAIWWLRRRRRAVNSVQAKAP